MSISYQEVAHDCASFYVNGIVSAGQICYVSGNNTVKFCEEGNPIHGQVVGYRCGVANVTVRGFIKVGYSGTAPTLGYCPLVAYNSRSVKVSEGAKEYLVVSVDTTNKEICILL